MMEPKVGIKFRINARNPHTTGNSNPVRNVPVPIMIPVASEMMNFIEMN